MISYNEPNPGIKIQNFYSCGLSGNYKFSNKNNKNKILLTRKGNNK